MMKSRVKIIYCTQCRWLPRACWMAQELLTTFEQELDEVTEKTRVQIMELIRTSLKPEFLNRIDEVIMFSPLNRKDIREIVKLQIKELEELLVLQKARSKF